MRLAVAKHGPKNLQPPGRPKLGNGRLEARYLVQSNQGYGDGTEPLAKAVLKPSLAPRLSREGRGCAETSRQA